MSFKKSLDIGKIGETLYFHANEGRLEKLDGRAADFRNYVTGELTELKLDTFDYRKTPNFFMEVYSDMNKKTSGGPFRALENGCKYFVYMFIQNLKVFTFDTQKLVDRLKEIETTLTVSEVPNTSWLTKGFLVNRELLKDLYVESELEIKIKEEKK